MKGWSLCSTPDDGAGPLATHGLRDGIGPVRWPQGPRRARSLARASVPRREALRPARLPATARFLAEVGRTPRAQVPGPGGREIRRPSPGFCSSASPPSGCRDAATSRAFVTDVMLEQVPGAGGRNRRRHPPSAGRGRTRVRIAT
jgi:hypothetical protein